MGGGTSQKTATRAEPFVRRALDDDEVRASLRRASEEGRKLKRQLSGAAPGEAALRIAADRRLQQRLGAAAAALGDAGARIAEASPRRRRRRRFTTLLGLSALGGLAAVAVKKRRGGAEPEGAADDGAASTQGDAVRPAGSPSPLQ